MTSSATDEDQPPSYTEPSRKRRHVPTPDSEQPSKKARSQSSNDSALKLALDHLRVDPPSHPLYQRNVDFIVDQAMNGRRTEHAISRQIAKVLGLANIKKDELDSDELSTLRQQLLLISGRRILNALGAHLDYEFNFEQRKENFEIFQDGGGYKLAFVIHPVMKVEDDDDAAEAESVKRANDRSAKAVDASPTSSFVRQADEFSCSEDDYEHGSEDKDEDDRESNYSDHPSSFRG